MWKLHGSRVARLRIRLASPSPTNSSFTGSMTKQLEHVMIDRAIPVAVMRIDQLFDLLAPAAACGLLVVLHEDR